MRFLSLLILISASLAQADTALDLAIGQGDSLGMRSATIALANPIFGNLGQRGAFTVYCGGVGATAVAIGYQLGWTIEANALAIGVYSGPALITSTDSLVGSPLEFVSEAHIGLADRSGYLGVFYRHMSNAGISKVNIGQDSVGIELRW